MTEWSEHVKRYAKKHKMTYQQANKNDKCKEAYRKKRMSPKRMKMHLGAGGGAANGDRGDGRRRIPLASELPELPRELQEIIHEYLNCHDIALARYSSETQKIIIDSRLKKLMENLESRYPKMYNDSTKYMSQFKAKVKPEWDDFSKVNGEVLKNGARLLVKYCIFNRIELIKKVLRAGVNIDVIGIIGETPLTATCNEGNLELARFLIENGADPNKARRDSATPLFIASQRGYLEIVQLLID